MFYDRLREIQFPIILCDLRRHIAGKALKSRAPSAAQLIRIKNADDYHILSLIVIVMCYSWIIFYAKRYTRVLAAICPFALIYIRRTLTNTARVKPNSVTSAGINVKTRHLSCRFFLWLVSGLRIFQESSSCIADITKLFLLLNFHSAI